MRDERCSEDARASRRHLLANAGLLAWAGMTRGQEPRPIPTRGLFPMVAFGTMSCCTQALRPGRRDV